MIYINFRFQWRNTGFQKIFQHTRSHFKTLGIRRVTLSRSHLESRKYYAPPHEIQSGVINDRVTSDVYCSRHHYINSALRSVLMFCIRPDTISAPCNMRRRNHASDNSPFSPPTQGRDFFSQIPR